MAGLRRRRLLALLGSTATVTASGCIADSPASSADPPGADSPTPDSSGGGSSLLREATVVDYPGFVDGDASVSADEQTITYEDPEKTFTVQSAYEGETGNQSQLRVSRDLSGETMAAFIAPVYDENASAFEYHVFANEAFVSFAEWHHVAGSPSDPKSTGPASFETLDSGVSRTVIGPVDAGTAGVIDAPAEQVQNGASDLTGVIVTDGQTGDARSIPQVAWTFEYDSDTGTLTLTHEGGDAVQGDRVNVVVEAGEQSTQTPFEGEVTAGDRTTLDVPSEATVRVVWTSEEGSQSAVLAEWTGPDA